MCEISDRIQEMYGDSEKFIFLKLLMESICQLETDPDYNARGFEGYIGRERTFMSNLKSRVELNLKTLGVENRGIIVENEFVKEAQQYARYICNCTDEEAIAKFEALMREEDKPRGEVSPDLIIHSPLNLKNQIMCLEAKFVNNPEWFKDFPKLTRFQRASHYLNHYVEEDHQPEFFFHAYLYVAGNLEEKISRSHKSTKKILCESNQNIICIYKRNGLWYACTLNEILGKL